MRKAIMAVNPTAIVPYSEMERMAATVAKSKLFGVQQPEQALALMALCQAEGIHPMTAVRDYHIIQNRPSLKAETMLARFLQAGGKVQWHELTDKKAEATFSHPTGGTVRLDWTVERAKQAGLAGKDVWQTYPRPMLRSRLISEGVRTVCPSIVQGVYTPEEIENLTPEIATTVEQAVESFGKASMPNADVEQHLATIRDAEGTPQLKSAFQAAHKAAVAAKDERRIGTFSLAYEARKGELEQRVIEGQKDADAATGEQQ
jgi:hypothetical protein